MAKKTGNIENIISSEWKNKKLKENEPERYKNLTAYGNRTTDGKLQSIKNLKDVISDEDYLKYILTRVKTPLLEKDLNEKDKNVLWGRLLKYSDEIRNNLNVTEGIFYVQQQIYYMKDYPDLNNSSDLDNLHSFIMEQIIQKRYRKKLSRTKSVGTYKELEKLIKDSFSRMQRHELNLNLRRRDRKEDIKDVSSFDELANKISKRLQDNKKNEIDDAVKEWKAENK